MSRAVRRSMLQTYTDRVRVGVGSLGRLYDMGEDLSVSHRY